MKTKYALQTKVMKAAWTIFRKDGKSFSKALIKAWKWAKGKFVKAATVALSAIIGESAKAVKFIVNFECPVTDQVVSRTAWAPKSLLTNGNEIPVWFADKKAAELREDFSYNGRNGLIANF